MSRTLGSKNTAADIREYMNKVVSSNKEKLIASMLDSATGLYVEETDKNGIRKVYKRAPDSKANAYLMDQTIGKATEKLEISGQVALGVIVLPSKVAGRSLIQGQDTDDDTYTRLQDENRGR